MSITMYKRWAPPKSKRQLLYWLKLFKKAKTWQLLILLVLTAFIAATFLRLNNLGMVKRTDAVIQSDKVGDIEQTRTALVELQNYVSSHMNSSLGNGIYLENTYNKDRAAAIAAKADSHNPQSDVYKQASIDCQARFQGGVGSFRNDYVTCVQNAVSSLPAEQQTEVYLPRAATYHYNFASPLISLDLAGVATLLTILLFLFIVTRLILVFILRWMIKRRSNII